MGRGTGDASTSIEAVRRTPGSREPEICGGPGGRALHCDGFEHFVVETVPECCGNFLETGECCGNAAPGEELVPVEECPHAAENAHLRGRVDTSDEPF